MEGGALFLSAYFAAGEGKLGGWKRERNHSPDDSH
jgi:hypothetical protein